MSPFKCNKCVYLISMKEGKFVSPKVVTSQDSNWNNFHRSLNQFKITAAFMCIHVYRSTVCDIFLSTMPHTDVLVCNIWDLVHVSQVQGC